MGEVRLTKEGGEGVITISTLDIRNGLAAEIAVQLVEAREPNRGRSFPWRRDRSSEKR